MLVSGHCNHESCLGKSWTCKGSILKYIRRTSGGEIFRVHFCCLMLAFKKIHVKHSKIDIKRLDYVQFSLCKYIQYSNWIFLIRGNNTWTAEGVRWSWEHQSRTSRMDGQWWYCHAYSYSRRYKNPHKINIGLFSLDIGILPLSNWDIHR